MIKEDVISAVSQRAHISRYLTERVIDAALCEIIDALGRGEKVQFLGFGTFDTQTRNPRLGRNINTGEPVAIPARRVPVFRAGAHMKAAVGS